ncbi:hypothetical protein ABN306_11315 [Providencia huaxiensis]|uniref:Type 1 fimbrial protein n=2 Tax=Providencia huaxiensis TaxID=2027290 RepID=A0A345LSJ1_9GAMM|nr:MULTISPECIES: hypothetical protein [Providencia]AXH61081.1 hypothetical protein CYG50_03065 [Providencia huaxiensis]MBQ0267082.1 hypothetical protein [Providencia huaxiensis]MBQ0533494.1 hypothetical protein [Providencia huaxiensis]MBQ0587051.1 hypothetical protein [Providencia huaxiensis]MBZ3680337.1 hypothetical protein [Providencia rettgeri]
MNSSVKKIVMTFLAVATLSTNFSMFASENSDVRRSNTAVIRFTGAIVASPCVVEANVHRVETKCWNDNGKLETASADIQKLKNQETLLPNQKGTQQFTWINKDKTLGIYTIKYD